MNKLFIKIAALSVGLAMAAGAGVAIGNSSVKEAKADETSSVNLNSGVFDTDHITWTLDDVITIQQTKGLSSTAVNSKYIAGPRVYKGHILSFVAAENYYIKNIEITIDTTYFGNSMTAGRELEGNVVLDNATDVARTWTSESGGKHVVSSVDGLPAIYIQNVATESNVQLRFTALSITYGTSIVPEGPFTVTYNANGGVGSMTDETEYAKDADVTVRYCSFLPVDDYHEFDSFNTKADGSGNKYMGGESFKIEKNVTLYAIWVIKNQTLGDGSYKSVVTYVNPMPTEVDVLNQSTSVKSGLLSIDTSGVNYSKSSYKEYDIAKGEALTIYNHSNALITKVLFEVYTYDSIDVFVDGSSEAVHHGDGSNVGDHTKIELDVNATTSVKIQGNGGTGTFSQSFYGFEVYMRVGDEPVAVTGVTLNAESGNVYIEHTRQLTATVAPADATDKSVVWSSSNDEVATVDANGLVSGVSSGTVTITVTTNDGDFSDSFEATVKELSYGTEESPINTNEAREVLEITGGSDSAQELWVEGLASESYVSSGKIVVWLMDAEHTIDRYFELYNVEFSSSITADYTSKSNLLRSTHVLCHGIGTIYSNSVYELYQPTSGSKPVVESVTHTATSICNTLLALTSSYCAAYVDGETSYEYYRATFTGIWETLVGDEYYGTVSDGEKFILENAEGAEEGNAIAMGIYRYDFLTSKYGLNNFLSRSAVNSSALVPATVATNNSTDMLIIVAAFGVSTLFFVTLCVVRKRKGMNK